MDVHSCPPLLSVPGFPTGAGFCRALKLSPPQQVAVGLGLSRSSNPGVAKEGVKFLVARVPGLTGGGGGQLSLEALHSLLELVKSSEEIAGQVRIVKRLFVLSMLRIMEEI